MKCHKCGSKDHLQDQCDQATHFAFGGYTLLQTVQNPRIDTPRRTSRSSSSSGPPPMVDDSSSDGYAQHVHSSTQTRYELSSSESDDYYPKYNSPPDSEHGVPSNTYDVPFQVRVQQYIAALTENTINIPTPTAPPAVEVPFPLPLFSDSDHESVHHPWSLYPSSNDDIGSENAPSAPPAEELNDDDLDTIYSERTESIHALDSSGDNSERRGFGYHLHHTLDDSPTISEDLTNLPCVNPADDPSVSNFSSTSEETTTLRIEDTPGATWNVEPSSSSHDLLCCRCQRTLLPEDV